MRYERARFFRLAGRSVWVVRRLALNTILDSHSSPADDGILEHYAKHLDIICDLQPSAAPLFDGMSDALIWSDELTPTTPTKLIWSLRPLFYYRTGLILGASRSGAERWQLGCRLFPHWVGFHPSRCCPSPELSRIYQLGSAQFVRSLDDLTDQTAV